jgi:hypothetical protein
MQAANVPRGPQTKLPQRTPGRPSGERQFCLRAQWQAGFHSKYTVTHSPGFWEWNPGLQFLSTRPVTQGSPAIMTKKQEW